MPSPDKIDGVLGILGGMGPLATADFMQKVIEATPAERDQEHIPILVHAVPQVPDRSECIAQGNDVPLQWLLRGADVLQAGGAQYIAIPCNTAHFWHAPLQAHCDVPVLHIVDAAADALAIQGMTSGAIGLLATSGTVNAGIYQERLEKLGYSCVMPDAALQTDAVAAGIAEVKAGNMNAAHHLLETAAQSLRDTGCEAIVLGCTEIPIVLKGPGYLDATDALARAAVAWHLQAVGKAQSAAE